MGRGFSTADARYVRLRPLLAILVGALCAVAFVGASTTATAGRACLSDADAGGYSYAGHQADSRGHGVRASITLTSRPSVHAGHVAGWVGVGGRGQGTNGGDAWIQAGIASLRGLGTVLYAEIAREANERQLVVVDDDVVVGRPYRIAVLEVAGHPGWWRVWVDGVPATAKVHMQGTSGRWAAIATAESWNGGTPSCNEFGFRFERVAVSHATGGSWRPFVSGHRFLDGTHALRDLTATRDRTAAFVATSS
ncbi:MAG TPA: hypothetical protein VE444_07800 [Gaiellaceae bacterium]|nr:hypothetical protein [Gaiellaceae bacterium]